ncbi:hypothetical protein CRM22_010665 [Opisthorchis felineus]|uniref:Uncharacterized protein n=2 Tax=Opisthorchis felineus TaxID=147828 RepID=A0A4S2KQW3_OPIFE|nr:hypothetical protein CRM22_010665 [Opisthorchis felineus]
MNPLASRRPSLLTFLLVSHFHFLQMSFSAHLLLVCLLPSLISPDGISPTHWDYLMLSLRWPATLCNFTECSVVPQPVDFLIHGLWPTREPDIEPENCDSAPPFDIDLLKPLLEELNTYWPNLFPGADAHQFWHHEWHDHGRCAMEDSLMANVADYFRVSLNLRKKVDLLNVLELAGIKPNNDTVFQIEDVDRKLKELLTVRTQLYCLKRHHKNPHLFEVRICFKPDLTLTDCMGHIQCLASSTGDTDVCVTNPRDQIGGSLGAAQGYSAMPCPPGPVVFPSL